MFEKYDFDYLVDRMLSSVSDDLDKREGSVIYDAVAPSAMELANFYIALDMVMDEAFAESASYYYLVKRAAERGIYPKEETNAVCKMTVIPSNCTVRAGDRFNLDTMNYTVESAMEEEPGAYRAVCEAAGIQGNQQLGELLPIEYIEGLETARLTEILIPGEEEEDVEAFRERYFASFNSEAFGGNRADYLEKINRMDGVGGCKVMRAWNGGISPSSLLPDGVVGAWMDEQSEETLGKEVYAWLSRIYHAARQRLLTTGGKVRVVFMTSEFRAPTNTMVNMVQQALDPDGTAGEGDGIAPIGHVVRVEGVKSVSVSFTFSITYEDGYKFEGMEAAIGEAVEAYLEQLRQAWADSERLTVRISQAEALLLSIKGIVDVTDTRINGKAENLVLDGDCIPVRGEIHG